MTTEISKCHLCGEAGEVAAYILGELGVCRECAIQIIQLSTKENTP